MLPNAEMGERMTESTLASNNEWNSVIILLKGKRQALRKKAISKGMKLLTEDEVIEEVNRRRKSNGFALLENLDL